MLAKFGLPFDKATPLVHFPKALKCPRNNAVLLVIVIIIINTKHFLALTPAGAESDLNISTNGA